MELTLKPIRILLADDIGLIRTGLRVLLERIVAVEVVAEALDEAETIDLIKQHEPDILLMHSSMSRMNCLEMARRINKEFPKVRVILLSRHASGEYIGQALRTGGVAGYLMMSASPDELEQAVKTVAGGKTYLSNLGLKHLADFVRSARGKETLLERLTPRQREVFELVVQGQSTKQIGLALNISVKTVESHRAQIMERLDIHDTAGLVRYAIRVGVVELEDKTLLSHIEEQDMSAREIQE
jgi:DNA-binding NarL/FixJ family response regulator